MDWIRPLGVLALLSCSADKAPQDKGSVDTATTTPTGDSGSVRTDSGAPDTAVPPPPPIDGLPAGQWSDCRGTFGLMSIGEWTWRDAEGSCAVEGIVALVSGVLSITVGEQTDCESGIPWWMERDDGLPVRHTFSVTDSRLTLVPEIAIGSTGSTNFNEKHFYGQPFRKRWLVTNNDGLQSHFDACFSPGEVFFEGRYSAIDGSCDFLSCGGAISEWRSSEEGEIHIWTQCAGDCPCAGILQTASHTDTEMSGVYGFSNCAMSGTGSFTGERTAFPAEDVP